MYIRAEKVNHHVLSKLFVRYFLDKTENVKRNKFHENGTRSKCIRDGRFVNGISIDTFSVWGGSDAFSTVA